MKGTDGVIVLILLSSDPGLPEEDPEEWRCTSSDNTEAEITLGGNYH